MTVNRQLHNRSRKLTKTKVKVEATTATTTTTTTTGITIVLQWMKVNATGWSEKLRKVSMLLFVRVVLY